MSDLRPSNQKVSIEGGALRTEIALAHAYVERIEKLKKDLPNIVAVPGFMALGDYLRHHKWCAEQCLECFPWSRASFNKLAKPDLPCVYLTSKARKVHSELIEQMDVRCRNAKFLYDPQDLMEWFRSNLDSEVETVLVPLSYFAINPDAFRNEFLAEKEKRLQVVYENRTVKATAETGPNQAWTIRRNRISSWGWENKFKKQYREHLFQWRNDVAGLAEEQFKAPGRVVLKRYKVELPDDKLPKFLSLREVSETRNYSSVDVGFMTVRNFGWVRHTKWTDEGTVSMVAYTPGIAFGGRPYWRDYEIGCVDLWTAERFVNVFGYDALLKSTWRIDKDQCMWWKKGAKFGPGHLAVEAGMLLGVNYR